MFKLLSLFLLLHTLLFGVDNIEFYANNLTSQGSKVIADEEVFVIYKDSYLSADRAIYDKNSSVLELFGNVVILQGSSYQIMGEYVKLNLKEKKREISPFYMYSKQQQVWLSSSKTVVCKNDFNVESGLVSGCDPDNPMWEIYFSSADYNDETQWVNLYNARFHIGGVPVFYTPYFGYSLDTTRRTGLLIPTVGLSSPEGFYYEQPVYIVVGPSVDIELKPQVRTLRGQGIYGTVRFVDSANSSGSVTLGYFGEKESYYEKNLLQNRSHYGFDVNYENTKVFNNWLGWDLEGQSGLYVDAHWMNDVDYINLASSDTINNVTSNQVFSRANLFYNEEDNYYGSYFKYYLDLNPQNIDKRDSTLQKLPTLQYHHYLDAFIDQHLYYTVNMNANNYTRVEGNKGSELEVNVPVTLQTALFDEYVNVAYKAKLHGRLIDFRDQPDGNVSSDEIYESGYYGNLSHSLEGSTSLTKGYTEYSHTMGFTANYTFFGTDEKSGYYENVDANCSTDNPLYPLDCEFYTLSKVKDNVHLEFTQYILDTSGKEKIYHRLSQPINVDTVTGEDTGLGEFENELRWSITDRISFYDNTFYSFQRSEVAKTLNTIRYNDRAFNFGFSFLYENKGYRDQVHPLTRYLNTDLSYRYDKHYKYFTKYAYDLETRVKKYAEVGFLYSKRCWDFGLRYVENNRPVLLRGGITSSVYDKYIYITVIMKPLGGSDLAYRTTDTLSSQ